jgi:eukaryotic-like serine/threonine-protein kinase
MPVEMVVEPDKRRIRIVGKLTEHADLMPLLPHLREQPCIDLSGISRINSSGIRNWMTFIRSLPPEHAVELEGCPVAFVAQLNLISNLAGTARIRSVFAPYLCTRCDATLERLVMCAALPESTTEICDKCGGPTELDADMDEYFAFLTVPQR